MGKMTRRVARNMGVQRSAASNTNTRAAAETAEPQKKNLFQRAVGWLNKPRPSNAR